MWAPLAADLVADHTVIVPDLRGMGLSAHPAGGYDKKTQGGDVAGVLDALQSAGRARHPRHRQYGGLCVCRAASAIGDALRADRRAGTGRRALGRDPQEPAVVAFPLRRTRHGAAGEGRERIYLDRFWNEFSADPKLREPPAQHYARLYARPGAMHWGSSNSTRSIRTPSTTRPCSRRASSRCRCSRLAERIVRPDDGHRDALRGGRCSGRRYPEFWSLDDGRKPGSDHHYGPPIPRQGMIA